MTISLAAPTESPWCSFAPPAHVGGFFSLEQSIDFQALMLCTAEEPEQRRAAWNELLRLRAMRTAERVAEMEREQGLR
jgi:hypothetical protein